MIDGIEYDAQIKEYVATAMTGEEIFGVTATGCEARLREANRVWIEHCKKDTAIHIDIKRVTGIEISGAYIIGGNDEP